jgi:chemotaxis protein CheD
VLDGSSTRAAGLYLAPGHIVAMAEPCTLRTVLGSCVSVTLFDPHARAGGMNHFLLPGSASDESPERYGQGALDILLARLLRLGCSLENLEAGIFGGACVVEALANALHLGERNVDFAFAWLKEKQIRIVTRDVLGRQARRLEFSVADGSTRVRLLGGP